ncbi:glutamate receptor-like [Portunus trituberculatus]|uniref:glutamate receptor-like n=1 Tax=Portunus trituberculatus TaxID=210409 RepID=UPI001E1CDC0F|nr:glutamate receptor-like [Portunus trituberculatus]
MTEDEFGNFQKHKVKIVSVSYFPFVDFGKKTNESGTIVTLKDSLDARLIKNFAKKINFTYVVNEEPFRAFGLESNGIFDGMMGQLQREISDFCTIAGPSSDRLKVMNFLRGYPSDPLTVVSLKPSFLPRHLAFIRPFSAEVWLTTGGVVIIWGVTLWVLHLLGRLIRRKRSFQFITALFYGWGALLEQPPSDPSTGISEQTLVGWWLVFCLIISTAFRSSLISHLTVQGTIDPIETLEDLTKANNWRWGTEPWLMNGVPRRYFSNHTDPIVKKIYAHMEIFDAPAGLKEIQKGGFSLIDFEKYINIIIESRYTDAQGRTPFYISKQGFRHVIAFGWCFRKGAPYFSRFSDMMIRLDGAGIIDYWLKDVVAKRVRANKLKEDPDPDTRYDLDTSKKMKMTQLWDGSCH